MRERWLRLGAYAGTLGGLAWLVKGSWTLITLDQPPFVYEAGPPLFLITTWALWSIIPKDSEGAAAARVALVTASALFVVAAAVAILSHFRAASWSAISSTASLLAMIVFLLALAWVGVLVRRTRSLPPKHGLPLGMAVALLPLLFIFGVGGIMIGGVWETRLIEVPIVLWGLGWMWVGQMLWKRPLDGSGGLSGYVQSA